jgi:hypothetical protein
MVQYFILPVCTAIVVGAVAWLFWLRRKAYLAPIRG